jgi:predicted RNA-binding Zn-ribbon protein involved in translation (DUF1610 family)
MVEILEKVEFDIDDLIDYQLGRVLSCECWMSDDLDAEQEILRILKLQNPLSPIDGACPTCGSKNIYLYEQYTDWDYEDNMTIGVTQEPSHICLSCGQALKEYD